MLEIRIYVEFKYIAQITMQFLKKKINTQSVLPDKCKIFLIFYIMHLIFLHILLLVFVSFCFNTVVFLSNSVHILLTFVY